MDISIIIPAYNAEDYIERCIKAVNAQDFPSSKYEVIVINNNSSDATKEILSRFNNIKVLEEEQQGAYVSRNKGVGASRGRILAFTDSDCAPCPDWLKTIYREMTNPELSVLLGKNKLNLKCSILGLLTEYENQKDSYVYSSMINELYYARTNNLAIRREIFDMQGGFVERLRGGDVILVRNAVDMYSCAIAKHCPDMQVVHMEIEGVFDAFKKMFVYGKSCHLFSKVKSFRPLNLKERLAVYHKVSKGKNVSPIGMVVLLFILSVGLCCWTMGTLYAMTVKGE